MVPPLYSFCLILFTILYSRSREPLKGLEEVRTNLLKNLGTSSSLATLYSQLMSFERNLMREMRSAHDRVLLTRRANGGLRKTMKSQPQSRRRRKSPSPTFRRLREHRLSVNNFDGIKELKFNSVLLRNLVLINSAYCCSNLCSRSFTLHCLSEGTFDVWYD